MSNDKVGNRWTVVLGGLIIQIILGTVYALSLIHI